MPVKPRRDFPALLFAIQVWNSEPYVFRWAPLLLAAGPRAYVFFRFVLKVEPGARLTPAAAPEERDQ
jgi:hypothetical protein